MSESWKRVRERVGEMVRMRMKVGVRLSGG